MQVAVSLFKAKCTEILRELPKKREPIEITSNGKLIAIVTAPPLDAKINPAWGALRGAVTHIAEDFDEPLGDSEWEASK